MKSETTITVDGRSRDVEYNTDDNEHYLTVTISAKEAVDALNALTELVTAVETGTITTDLPVHNVRNLTSGGINIRDESSLMLTSQEDVEVMMMALARHDPDNGFDLTNEIFRAVIEAVKQSPFKYDTEELEQLYKTHKQ